jgi:hypothetical protein
LAPADTHLEPTPRKSGRRHAHHREPPCLHRCTPGWSHPYCACRPPAPPARPYKARFAQGLLCVQSMVCARFANLPIDLHPMYMGRTLDSGRRRVFGTFLEHRPWCSERSVLPASLVWVWSNAFTCSHLRGPQSGIDTTFSGMDTTFDYFWHTV